MPAYNSKAIGAAKWGCPIGAVLLGVIALGVFYIVPLMVNREVEKEDHLGRYPNGTFNVVLRKFQSPQYAMSLQVWTFSVTNAPLVIGYGAKPMMREKGPYTFTETQRKVFLQFAKDDTRIFYRNNRTYVFDPVHSCPDCHLSDMIMVPNIVFQKLADISMQNPEYAMVINEALKLGAGHESVFTVVSVGDFLFNGYVDPLIGQICDNAGIVGHLLHAVCKILGLPERIGLLYGQNNTNDGLYEIDTGLTDAINLGRVYSWNGANKLNMSHWYGTEARMINGTDGELFKPALSANEELEIFVGQACRSMQLSHSGYSQVEGVPTYVYVPSAAMNDVPLERRKGFCNPGTPAFFNDTRVQEKACAPSGLLDMNTCVAGKPPRIFLSQSHFYGSPPELWQAVEGVRPPTAADDATYVSIEPISGVVVEAQRRSMLSLGVISGALSLFQNMRKVIVPMVRMNETALIDEDTRQQILRPIRIIHFVNVVALLLGILAVVCIAGFVGIVIFEKISQNQSSNAEGDAPLVEEDHPLANAEPEEYGPIDGAVEHVHHPTP